MNKRKKTPVSSSQERLLEAAMDVFGKHGYEAATTRMIAKEAGVNISAIPYYYEGKRGLYEAVINHIVVLIQGHFGQVREVIDNQDLSGPQARQNAAALIEQIVERMITFMVGSPQAPRVARIILREQLDPSVSYHLIFKGFMELMVETIADLLQVMAPAQDRQTAKLRVMALFGQVMAFRVARETVVRALDFEGYSSKELAAVRAVILAHTRAILSTLG